MATQKLMELQTVQGCGAMAQPIKQFAQANSSLIILVFWTTYLTCMHENRNSTLERISPPCEKFQTQHTSTLNSRVCKKVKPFK